MATDPRRDALRALAETGLRLARGTTSARLALAGLRDVVDPATLAPEIRGRAVEEMERAHAEATRELSFKEVEKALSGAWGQAPGKVLDELDTEPVARTPAAQVHRGVHEGADVAVKVLRPGLPDQVRLDLNLLETLIRPLGAVFPSMAAGLLLREVRERILDELDLEHEASTQRAFARALRRHKQLFVPAPVSALCHERVLVSAWVDGTPVGKLTDPEQRAAAARALVLFHVGSARFGTVHADPHPADAMRMADGRFAFLDFGAARQVSATRVDEGLIALDALLAQDAETLGTSLELLGWLPAEVGATTLFLGRDILAGRLDGPSRMDASALVETGKRTAAHAEALWPLAQVASVPPEDLWPLRMLGALVTLLARLDVEEDWPALFSQAARDGW
ncbi:MAG: AarF/UbiB family protein [Actinomycetota bacterium]|nr:AarF/UbiB family protein [Actinomycetota bacterium]